MNELLPHHIAEDRSAFLYRKRAWLGTHLQFVLFAPEHELLIREIVQPFRNPYRSDGTGLLHRLCHRLLTLRLLAQVRHIEYFPISG